MDVHNTGKLVGAFIIYFNLPPNAKVSMDIQPLKTRIQVPSVETSTDHTPAQCFRPFIVVVPSNGEFLGPNLATVSVPRCYIP